MLLVPPNTRLVYLVLDPKPGGKISLSVIVLKPSFCADEDVWVGWGDEVAKFGRFVFYASEIDVGDFEWFVSMSGRWCCYWCCYYGCRAVDWGSRSVVGRRYAGIEWGEELLVFIEAVELKKLVENWGMLRDVQCQFHEWRCYAYGVHCRWLMTCAYRFCGRCCSRCMQPRTVSVWLPCSTCHMETWGCVVRGWFLCHAWWWWVGVWMENAEGERHSVINSMRLSLRLSKADRFVREGMLVLWLSKLAYDYVRSMNMQRQRLLSVVHGRLSNMSMVYAYGYAGWNYFWAIIGAKSN